MMAATEAAGGSPSPGKRVRATVVAVLPNALFRLRLENGTELTGHVGGELRKGFTRLVPGDVVSVEPSPFDPARARICCDS